MTVSEENRLALRVLIRQRGGLIGAAAGVFAAAWAVWIWFVPSPADLVLSPGLPFKETGHLATDVQRALISLGELGDGSDRQTTAASIKQAEHRRGLPPDGVPDERLLHQLIVEIKGD